MAVRPVSVRLRICPLTKGRWRDFEHLFGQNGACGGCWCMLWRLSHKDFQAGKGTGNRRAMKALVNADAVPGLLAYVEDVAVAWCAVAPREHYPALSRSRILRPVDDQPCWSVSCLFVRREYRRKGLSSQLLHAAVEHAQRQGGRIVEGYPVDPQGGRAVPAAFAWTGIAKVYESVGFSEVARRSSTRPIMRIEI